VDVRVLFFDIDGVLNRSGFRPEDAASARGSSHLAQRTPNGDPRATLAISILDEVLHRRAKRETPRILVGTRGVKSRSGRDSKARSKRAGRSTVRHPVTTDHAQPITDTHRENVERNGSSSSDAIALRLSVALAGWCTARNRRELRRALIVLLGILEAR
jgi:hypothetical protein